MLKLDAPLVLDAAAIRSPNLCERFSDDDLTAIGIECAQGYARDEQSREGWLRRNEAGMDLALQIQKDKSFPWEGCANVAFPLVTIAAMQFHARAYPAIVGGSKIVKCQVFGDDPSGQLTARAERVSTHMSWQLLQEDACWEEQEDKALLNLSIVGTNFKKSYYSPGLGHNVSELVLAKDLVLNYWSKSVNEAPRKTHKVPKFRNEVYENVMREIWRDVLGESWYLGSVASTSSPTQQRQDQRQGVTAPQPDDTTSLLFLEQHVNLDLDGDGYAEPYIITFEAASKYVVRIVCRFERESDIERITGGARRDKIIQIASTEYFTKKTFIPSPDGGIYDVGFGVFLGPLNEAVNSLVNMLLDAGTMQTTAGGFLGRGAKIRSGTTKMGPFEWKRVDASGDDIRKNILPLPVNAPSDVLFQLLSLLINYTNRVAGTTDMMVGENPGQNTPASTAQTMVEMGQKIYTAIFKRVWRATKEEFQKLYKLNAVFLPQDVAQAGGATRADYAGNGKDIAPAADPNVTSETQRVQLAGAVKQAAATTPGYDHDAVERRYLAALHIEGIDQIFPGTKGAPPPKDPKVALQEVKDAGALQRDQLALQWEQQKFVMELMEEQRLNNAKIAELGAKAANEAASAQTEQAYAQVAIMNAEISRIRATNEKISHRIDAMLNAAKIRADYQAGTLKKEAA